MFVRTSKLISIEGEMSSCYLDLEKISVDNLKPKVVERGFGEHRIRKLHPRKPNVIFDQALVPIESDENVCYLIGLYSDGKESK